jgi:hypothetical protein
MILEERHTVPVEFSFRQGVVLSAATFDALPTVSEHNASVFAPGHFFKTLIERDARRCWHLVEIERHSNGVDHVEYYASKIIIRAYQPE